MAGEIKSDTPAAGGQGGALSTVFQWLHHVRRRIIDLSPQDESPIEVVLSETEEELSAFCGKLIRLYRDLREDPAALKQGVRVSPLAPLISRNLLSHLTNITFTAEGDPISTGIASSVKVLRTREGRPVQINMESRDPDFPQLITTTINLALQVPGIGYVDARHTRNDNTEEYHNNGRLFAFRAVEPIPDLPATIDLKLDDNNSYEVIYNESNFQTRLVVCARNTGEIISTEDIAGLRRHI